MIVVVTLGRDGIDARGIRSADDLPPHRIADRIGNHAALGIPAARDRDCIAVAILNRLRSDWAIHFSPIRKINRKSGGWSGHVIDTNVSSIGGVKRDRRPAPSASAR